MYEDFYIRIGIVGKLIDVDYKLILEGRGNINLIIYVECELKVCFDFIEYFFFEI